MSTLWLDDLHAEIVRRDFTPKLVHERPIRALVTRHHDPAEAWESLVARGFLPASWAFSPSRSFEEHDGISAWDAWLSRVRRAPIAHPTSLDGCVHAAAGVRSLVTAEHLALEVVRRTLPDSLPTRVVWVLSPEPRPVPGAQLGLTPLDAVLTRMTYEWKLHPQKKRSFRDRSARRRALAHHESERRQDRWTQAFTCVDELCLFDATLASIVGHARILAGEGILAPELDGLAWRDPPPGRPVRPVRHWPSVTALLPALVPLMTLLALGVNMGPVVEDTMYLVVRG